MEKTTVQKIKKAASITANVLIWVFVVFSLLVTVLVFTAQGDEDGVPSLFGKSLVTIESESMEPTYKKGDLVFMKKLTPSEKDELKVGEIITYFVDLDGDGDLELNTHRIDKIDGNKYVTKGDNNKFDDNSGDRPYTVQRSDIIGKCEEDDRIGGFGAVIGFLRSSLGFFICIVLPLILFFLYELYRFIMLVVSERAKRAPVSSETEEEIKRRAIEEYIKSQKAAEDEKADSPAEEAPAAEAPTEEAVEPTAEKTEAPENTEGDN